MTSGRSRHTATLLPSGQVLITGGWGSGGERRPPALLTAEIYDPFTGTFVATASMNDTRQGHTASLLRNGNVLVTAGAVHLQVGTTGGVRSGEISLNTAEIYTPRAP